MILRAMFVLSLLLTFLSLFLSYVCLKFAVDADTATILVMQQLQVLHTQKLAFQCACNAMPLLAFRPCTLCMLRVVCCRIVLGQTKLSQVVCDMDKKMRVMMLLTFQARGLAIIQQNYNWLAKMLPPKHSGAGDSGSVIAIARQGPAAQWASNGPLFLQLLQLQLLLLLQFSTQPQPGCCSAAATAVMIAQNK
jgi:hypothetical protein